MSRAERIVNLLGVVVPFVGVLIAIVLLWNRAVNPTDLAILVVMYLLTGAGVTVGYHRLLTHRAFQTHPWLERTFAVLGSMSVQGSVMDWVADHRKHHAHADREGDPHSPHVGHGSGLAGLWHAHVGWLLETRGQADGSVTRPSSTRTPRCAGSEGGFRCWSDVVLVPTAAGFVLSGFTRVGAAEGLVWGGLVRIFFVHHITWSVNSVCHFFGSRRFDVEDQSTNVVLARAVLARRGLAPQPPCFPTLGVPRAAVVGARPAGGDHLREERSGWPGTWCGSRPNASGHARWPRPARASRRPDCRHGRRARQRVGLPATNRVRGGASRWSSRESM